MSLLSLLFFALVLASCSESKGYDKFHNWRERNEAFIDSLQGVIDTKPEGQRDGLECIQDSRNKDQNIFFKRISKKENSDKRFPVLTSKVSVFYRGMLINEEVFGATSAPRYYTKEYKSLDVFDQNFTEESPTEFDNAHKASVTSFIAGWIEILQHMQPGERWEIYIPYYSAYGEAGSGESIPAYSALIFDIELEEITEY
ncbi:peptidylprolyl isomerase [Bacteroides sp. 224]|nr:peptidylprolyl isomerase [Bacteroides sp. 224]